MRSTGSLASHLLHRAGHARVHPHEPSSARGQQTGLCASAGLHLGRRTGRWRELGSSWCGLPPMALRRGSQGTSPSSRLLGPAVGGPADGGEAAAPASPFP